MTHDSTGNETDPDGPLGHAGVPVGVTADVALDEPTVVRTPVASMEQSTKSGVAWAGGSRLVLQLMQFASTIVLARLLVPSEFGLVVIVTAFTSFALFFTDLGLGAAIIHSDDVDEDLLCSAFWLNAITGVVLTVALSALARPIALLYGQPKLAGLLVLGSVTFTLAASTVHLAILERAMSFKRIAGAELGAALIGFSTAVALAARGWGAQSIIWGALAQTAVTTLLMWRLARWLPSKLGSARSVRELWAFSSHLFGFNIVNYWSRNLDDLLLGKYASPAALGVYNRAYGLMLLPVQQVTVAVGRVLFPSLSRLRHEPERLRSAYLRALEMLVGLVAPLSAGLSAAAVAFIEVAYGSRWAAAAPLLAILAASGPAQIVAGTGGAIFRALGLTKSLFRRSLINTSVTVVAIIIGLQWGATGVAVALLIKFYVLMPFTLGPAWKVMNLTVWTVLSTFRGIAVCSGTMAAAMVGAGWVLRSAPKFVVLVGQSVVGLVVYAIGVALFARPFGREFLALLGIRAGSGRRSHAH